jgi:hypothetical protein
MQHNDFSANGTADIAPKGDSLMLMVTGTFGSGTLALQKYSASRGSWVTITSWTEALTTAQEIYVGNSANLRLNLTGATSPNIVTDWWWE